jgi:hypothetical protein
MTGFCILHSFVDTKPFHNMIALHQMDFYIVAKQNLIDILSRLLKIISCKANGITQVVAMTTKVQIMHKFEQILVFWFDVQIFLHACILNWM